MRNANPVAVISAPVRLSGRRCHATSPDAANDPPTRPNTTSMPATGASFVTTIGRSTSTSPARARASSAAKNARLCSSSWSFGARGVLAAASRPGTPYGALRINRGS